MERDEIFGWVGKYCAVWVLQQILESEDVEGADVGDDHGVRVSAEYGLTYLYDRFTLRVDSQRLA